MNIQKYTFGTPLDTDAVVLSVPASADLLPFFTVSRNGCSVSLPPGCIRRKSFSAWAKPSAA